MSVYHYSRVSTLEQTVENQKLAAQKAGYAVDYWYADSGVSGGVKAEDRPQFSLMMEKMSEGDVLVISDISRLGRNTIDVLTNVDKFEEKGVKVCVLNYGNLDLTSDMGRVIITMAAAFAQLERSDLKRKTKAGMARTVLQGTKLGQPLKIAPNTLEAIAADKKEGLTLDELATKYSVARNTLYTNLQKWGNNLKGYREEFDARQAQYAARVV